MRRWMRGAGVLIALLIPAGTAHAAAGPDTGWLPDQADASWTYGWSDSAYSPQVTYERYTVAQHDAASVTLQWTSTDAGNDPGAPLDAGSIKYDYTDAGIVNETWSSTAPPPQFPILCSTVGQCGNSMAGAHYVFVWGSRSPLLQEPLFRGATWQTAGGQGNDVGSANRYLGRQRVTVPAFPNGVYAAAVQSDITQAGAIGDPYGSGIRTTWWVYGVGPVKSVFRHAGGEVTTVELYATDLAPRQPPSDIGYLPFRKGEVQRFRYTNSRYMRRASVQQFTVNSVGNGTADILSKTLSGPISSAGEYLLTTRTSGVQGFGAATTTATNVPFPKLGPRFQPASKRRHFYTPFDLMAYGFNPVLPAYPHIGQTWRSSRGTRDYQVFGVTGTSKVIGLRTVRTPKGRFKALLVISHLKQAGYKFGSGVRRSWFAPGVGLVKLEFRHADGSVSRVVRLK